MKLDLRNNFDSIFDHLVYVLAKLLIKGWIAVRRPSFCYDRVWPLEIGCNRNCFDMIATSKCGPDFLVLVHAWCLCLMSYYLIINHSESEWTGQPSSATQASLNQSAEMKQLHQRGQLQQLATNAPVGQFVLEATTPASQPLYRASDCKSVSERLAAEITAAVIHIIGAERPDAQTRYNIGAKITQIIGRYNFKEVDTK